LLQALVKMIKLQTAIAMLPALRARVIRFVVVVAMVVPPADRNIATRRTGMIER